MTKRCFFFFHSKLVSKIKVCSQLEAVTMPSVTFLKPPAYWINLSRRTFPRTIVLAVDSPLYVVLHLSPSFPQINTENHPLPCLFTAASWPFRVKECFWSSSTLSTYRTPPSPCTQRNVTQVLRSKMVWTGEISVLVTLKGYRPLRNTFGASKPG